MHIIMIVETNKQPLLLSICFNIAYLQLMSGQSSRDSVIIGVQYSPRVWGHLVCPLK